ncbi:4-aminobutyrate--2-oxoglutarate transaminase [Leptolyngbya valderiana BDU 20041]|nr:4-aminobutyrate--2-oxoglutarate transaminase [Leptolyngbya valderiana BDU 20041]
MPAAASQTASQDLVARRQKVVCSGVGMLSPMTAASASGAIITDADGREFIDFASGIGVMSVGHGDPAVVQAVSEQVATLQHACIHVATYEPYIALCEKLVELFPHHERDDDSTKAMLISTGAEAVENAIKIARQATGRAGVICFTGAFHGRTLLAGTLTSKVHLKQGCGPYAPEVYRLPFPRPLPGETISEADLVSRELGRLERAFHDTVAASQVAAIIIEVVQGEGGFSVAPKAYLQGLRRICDEHGIVLIFDEVQSGFCRTGKWAAYEHFGVKPDLSPWAKAMGGGLPMACVIGKASVMDRVNPGTLGGTYGGNPVACAASLAAIDRMEELKLNARAERIGGILGKRFTELQQRVKHITDVRGLGAMMAIELSEGGDPTRPAGALVKAVIDDCRSKGLLIIAAGVSGNCIRVLTPLVITEEQLNQGLDILCQSIEQHAAQH